MFYSDSIDEAFYADIMEQIKQINAVYIKSHNPGSISDRPIIKNIRKYLGRGDIGGTARCIGKYIEKKANGLAQSALKKNKSNYFSSERIAIYTVITGDYDRLMEPYCHPDNCDYFVFTDSDSDELCSVWKKRRIPDSLDGLSNAEKSRYLKMHPQELFPAYRYSVYVDGNIQIMTDMTEYINKLGPIGIGTHLHPIRDCVFDEMQRVIEIKKEDPKNIKRHAAYMRKTGMPRHYGLLECNVIARDHNNPLCIKIMDDWWNEYEEYSKRDQISLPHVLFQNGISVREVGVLGDNVRINPSFRIYWHD